MRYIVAPKGRDLISGCAYYPIIPPIEPCPAYDYPPVPCPRLRR